MNIIELAKKAGMTRRPADRQCRAPYWDVVIDSELESFAALVLEHAANGADALAKKWWARHCETNRHMETTREAHEDFCQLGQAIRALKGAKE